MRKCQIERCCYPIVSFAFSRPRPYKTPLAALPLRACHFQGDMRCPPPVCFSLVKAYTRSTLTSPAAARLPARWRPSSCRRTKRRWGRPRWRRGIRQGGCASDRYPDGAHTALREALGAAHGLDPARIVCGNGSDELFHILAQAYLGPGDEAIYTAHGFLVYRIAILATAPSPVVAPEREPHRRRDGDPEPRHAAHPRRLHREPEQPDRHLSPRNEMRLLAERAAGQRAAGDRRGLWRICAPQRLRARHRAGVDRRQHDHDAHLLQDLRPRRGARRLGLLRRGRGAGNEPIPQPVQPGRRRRWRRPWRRWTTRRISHTPRRTTRMARLGDGGTPQDWHDVRTARRISC